MSNAENVPTTDTTVAPETTPESEYKVVIINKKKIKRYAAISTAAIATVAAAIFVKSKMDDCEPASEEVLVGEWIPMEETATDED